jgi:hypothetical protein
MSVKGGISSRKSYLQTYFAPASPRLNRPQVEKKAALSVQRVLRPMLLPRLSKHFCSRTVEYVTLLAKERVSNDRAENGTYTNSSCTKLPR